MSKTSNLGLWVTAAIGGVSWFMCLKDIGGAMQPDNRSNFVLCVVTFCLVIQLPRILGLKLQWIQILEAAAILSAGFLAGALLASYEGPSGIILPTLYIGSYIAFLLPVRGRGKQPEGELLA